MKVSFTKISTKGDKISLERDGVKFTAIVSKLNENSINCEGKIHGTTSHFCDRCGDEFELKIDEHVELIAHNGVAKGSNEELENIIEFFDGQVDFDEIFISELEAFKSDYFYCKNCTK